MGRHSATDMALAKSIQHAFVSEGIPRHLAGGSWLKGRGMSSVTKTLKSDFARAMTVKEWRRTFFFDLKQWAMDGQEVRLIEATS